MTAQRIKIPELRCERCGHPMGAEAGRSHDLPEVQIALVGHAEAAEETRRLKERAHAS
jgi:hypothetical protein